MLPSPQQSFALRVTFSSTAVISTLGREKVYETKAWATGSDLHREAWREAGLPRLSREYSHPKISSYSHSEYVLGSPGHS